jgi:hypothetical protein
MQFMLLCSNISTRVRAVSGAVQYIKYHQKHHRANRFPELLKFIRLEYAFPKKEEGMTPKTALPITIAPNCILF